MLKEATIKCIEEILGNNYYKKDSCGCWFCDIDADYRDEFDEGTIKKIVKSKHPKETFQNLFYEGDFDYWEWESLFKLLKDNLEEYEELKDEITEWLNENVYFNPPFTHYKNQNVLVNILVDTGDGNYDYTCNNLMNFYKDKEIYKESSILWLIKQQGYTKRDLLNVIKNKHDKNDKFLNSISDELLNSCSHMNALVFSVKMSLGELINYLEHPTDIILDKGTSCGLVDFWNGSGSLLDISLKKDVVISKEYANVSIDGGHGYSISEIYGILSSYWTNTFVA
ncbi:MAG: hypothetical protein M0Q88_08025 [Bacilli bacterium]|nr:hypothetical protein [Bacilli bacterium]